MTASLKMNRLKQKISELETTYQSLNEQRSQEIAKLICALELSDLESQTLAGGLLFIKQKINDRDAIKEEWLDAGRKFLRAQKPRSKRKTSAPSQPTQKTKAADRKDSSTASTGEESHAKVL